MQHKENSLQDNNLLERSFHDELYRRYASGLFAYVYQQISSREDAEDIVLDVFLAVLQNKHFVTFDEKKQEAWLWRITHNKVVDAYRRTVSRKQVSIEWLSEPLYEDDLLAPDQVSLKHEEYTQLYNAVYGLPESHQEVLRLRFGHGLKCSQIAPILEKSHGAVRTILYRTLQMLRTVYRNQEKDGK